MSVMNRGEAARKARTFFDQVDQNTLQVDHALLVTYERLNAGGVAPDEVHAKVLISSSSDPAGMKPDDKGDQIIEYGPTMRIYDDDVDLWRITGTHQYLGVVDGVVCVIEMLDATCDEPGNLTVIESFNIALDCMAGDLVIALYSMRTV